MTTTTEEDQPEVLVCHGCGLKSTQEPSVKRRGPWVSCNDCERKKDQPPVIVPPDGLADALDAHAATVTEEDAEATHPKVRQSIQEARKKIWGDRIGEAKENNDCHATAIKTAADKAKEIVHGRNGRYGKPERSQERIAKLWSAYLGVELTARQVCGCMTLLKIGRLAGTPDHEDSLVDAIGYLLLFEECGKKADVA